MGEVWVFFGLHVHRELTLAKDVHGKGAEGFFKSLAIVVGGMVGDLHGFLVADAFVVAVVLGRGMGCVDLGYGFVDVARELGRAQHGGT